MRRARPSDDEIEKGIERAAKRARVDATGLTDGEKLFNELLLHFTQLGPAFTYADWALLTQLKAKFSGIGNGGEIYIAGWRAMCFRDFESVVRTRNGRGPYQFLMNLEAHWLRRKLELQRNGSVTATWLRGYWRRAYVVCGHFVREIFNECAQSPFGIKEDNFAIVGDSEVVSYRLQPHGGEVVEMEPEVTMTRWTQIDRRRLPISMACAGIIEGALRIPLAPVAMRERGSVARPVTYDPLVTEEEEATPDDLRNVIMVLQHTYPKVQLEVPMGGPTQWRPIRWHNTAIAVGTLEVFASNPTFYYPTLAVHAVDVELYWSMVMSHRTREDSTFPAELMRVPDEWNEPEFEHRRRFMMGARYLPMDIIVRDFYLTTEGIHSSEWVILFGRVPDYNTFWNALPREAADVWLDEFDRIVMMEHDSDDTIPPDPLRNARRQLVIYKCRRCAGPAAFVVLETGEARCVNCAM